MPLFCYCFTSRTDRIGFRKFPRGYCPSSGPFFQTECLQGPISDVGVWRSMTLARFLCCFGWPEWVKSLLDLSQWIWGGSRWQIWIIISVDKLVHQKTFQLFDFRTYAKRVVAVIQILGKQFFCSTYCLLPTVIPSISVRDEKVRKLNLQGRSTICGLTGFFNASDPTINL